MKRKAKLLLAALGICLLTAVIAAASFTAAAADEKNGMFNGSPAAVDDEGNLLLNKTNFPDERLLSYVSDFDTDSDGKLSEAEVAEVKKIDVHIKVHTSDTDERINLSGICYFTSLTYLNCSQNIFEELDVSKCTELEYLSCSSLSYTDDIHLTKLDVSQCTKLTYLNCSNNDIAELDVSKCTKLTYLDCSNNDIAELDVSKCADLTSLDCSDNDIAELDVSKCADLTSLYCYYNNIAELDVSKCADLTRLYCYYNNIAELDVSKCADLTRLDCSDNDIAELDVSNCTKLTDLECENNNITELDVSKCTELKNLECENNRITKIDLSSCPDINTAMLGQYVNISDIKMNENAKPKYMSFGVNSYFDKDENVYKVDYAEYLEYINSIAKKWNAENPVEPFKSTKGEFEEKFNDGSSRKTLWDDNWYIDSDDDDRIPYRPDDGHTYYWTSYKDGAFVGISLDEQPECSDYYEKSISYITYEIYGVVISSGGMAADYSLFDLTLYITPEPTLTDSDTDVTAEYPKEEHDDYAGVVLNAEKLTEGSEYDAAEKALGSEYTDIVPYSLTLTDENGTPVSVKSKLTVSVPVPEGWEAGETLVFYIDGEGNAVDMNAAATGDGKFVTFETTHFSTYALVNAATKKDKPLTPGDADGDGAVGNSDALAIFTYMFNQDSSALDTSAADVNGDGEINNSDALAIFRYLFDPELYPLMSGKAPGEPGKAPIYPID